jgi:hypothetical protein
MFLRAQRASDTPMPLQVAYLPVTSHGGANSSASRFLQRSVTNEILESGVLVSRYHCGSLISRPNFKFFRDCPCHTGMALIKNGPCAVEHAETSWIVCSKFALACSLC